MGLAEKQIRLVHYHSIFMDFVDSIKPQRGRRGRDPMVVGYYLHVCNKCIYMYHHWCCEFESRSGRGVQHYL